MAIYWMSFCGDNGRGRAKFLGVAIVEAPNEFDAIKRAHELGINPGGEIMIQEIPPEYAEAADRNRLLSEAEAKALTIRFQKMVWPPPGVDKVAEEAPHQDLPPPPSPEVKEEISLFIAAVDTLVALNGVPRPVLLTGMAVIMGRSFADLDEAAAEANLRKMIAVVRMNIDAFRQARKIRAEAAAMGAAQGSA